MIFMNKAKKYKYKYLELKKRIEYIGEGGIKHSETYNNCKKDCKIENNVYDSIFNLKYKYGNRSLELQKCIEKCKEIENLSPQEEKRLQEENEAVRIKQEKEHRIEMLKNMERSRKKI